MSAEFLSNVDSGVDRYPDVRGPEGWTVVDAVAEKANDVALCM